MGLPADPPAARLFLGLWPPAAVRDAVLEHAERWSWPRGARRVRHDKVHLTLHFIGAVPRGRVAALAQALAVPMQPFELRLDHGELWPGGIAVLASRSVPAALADLHARLGQALDAAGLPPEARPLRAHVTLARHARHAVVPPPGEDIAWPVDRYVLVESDTRPPTQYRVLASFGNAA